MEGAMIAKRILQSLVIIGILVASFASAGVALAWSGCSGYITVQWGDTLSSIATGCGTTVEAIRAANPGLGWWVYAGQVLYMPMGTASASAYYPAQSSGSTYVVQWGDTLGDIAVRYGVSLSDILAVNPQIWNASLIFPGQVINLPAVVNSPLSMTYVSNSYPTTYCPCTSNPPTYYPPTYYPSPAVSSQFSDLEVTSGPGLLVRSGPGRNFSEIVSPFVSAVKDTTWRYRKSSITVDSSGLVWVEVALPQMVNGYSTGWILVRDTLGSHFTEPNIDP
jgi:LysM repeat protein